MLRPDFRPEYSGPTVGSVASDQFSKNFFQKTPRSHEGSAGSMSTDFRMVLISHSLRSVGLQNVRSA